MVQYRYLLADARCLCSAVYNMDGTHQYDLWPTNCSAGVFIWECVLRMFVRLMNAHPVGIGILEARPVHPDDCSTNLTDLPRAKQQQTDAPRTRPCLLRQLGQEWSHETLLQADRHCR